MTRTVTFALAIGTAFALGACTDGYVNQPTQFASPASDNGTAGFDNTYEFNEAGTLKQDTSRSKGFGFGGRGFNQ